MKKSVGLEVYCLTYIGVSLFKFCIYLKCTYKYFQGKWNSRLDTLKQEQRTGYREWIMQTVEEMQGVDGLYSPIG